MFSAPKTKKLVKKARIKAKTFRLLTPVNLKSERDKFFRKSKYNPQFKYPKTENKLFENTLEKLSAIDKLGETDFEKKYWKSRIKETKLKLALLLSVGRPEKITTVSKKLYQCNFKTSAIKSAKKDAKLDKNTYSNDTVNAEDMAKRFTNYLLEEHGARSWTIRIKKNASFYIQVRYKKNLITINDTTNWNWASLDSILAHEIDGHIARALNANNQKGVFKNPMPFYIKTEEGLASYLADYHAESCEVSRKHHAIKFLGGVLALTASFREVYNFLLDSGFDRELAFQRAFRLKRGFTDTSLPGCFAREAMYYEGMLEVKDYVESGGDTKRLFAGKVGLEDLKYTPLPKDTVIPSRLLN